MNAKSKKPGTTIQSGIVRTSSVGWLIKMLARQMDSAMDEILEPLSVTRDQFKVLMTLLECEGLSQIEIGKRVGLPSYAITRLLDAMEESGLLERHQDENSRRSFSICLTKKGEALSPKLFDSVVEVNKQVLKPLSAVEKQQLKQLLGKVVLPWN